MSKSTSKSSKPNLSAPVSPSAFVSSLAIGLLVACSVAQGQIPDPLHRKVTVVSYDPGSNAAPRFLDPQNALGTPSQVNPFGEPTDPFNPPYGTNQIVSIGTGGHLAVRFHQPILNHPHNLGGLDFTIFGNAGFIITNEFDLTTFDWIGTPATDGALFGEGTGAMAVSVSRDGKDFFILDPRSMPRIDSFPPTDGAGDPGIPVPAGLSPSDFAGATLEVMRTLYAGSAGGASFDLENALDLDGRPVFLPEIRYIRIDVLEGRAEVDAIVAVNRGARVR
jgi:hypothetical protein